MLCKPTRGKRLRPYKLITSVLCALLFFGCRGGQQSEQDQGTLLPTLTVEEVRSRLLADAPPFILDVRTMDEFNGPLGHIEDATLIPIQELPDRLDELTEVQSRDIVVVCRSGNRSARGTRILLDAGFNAANMAGGMLAWNR